MTISHPNNNTKCFLLAIAGLGGLLYGIDIGVIRLSRAGCTLEEIETHFAGKANARGGKR